LALEKPEWGGHRQSELPRSRLPERDHDDLIDLPTKADLVIIGAGIMGVAAALHASAAGLDTVVIDRSSINGESSGGNAGSLHMQLLSFDYGEKTGGRSEALLQTLPLQRDAIALWQEHERALETSFEIALTGGLMLAEEGGHIEFLKQKVDAERRSGIEVELIDRDAIRAIAPAVSDRMIAGAWCPGEGKINPLIATPALARTAKDNGARFVEGVHVSALSHDRRVYAVETSAGSIVSKHLILAAGGWTGALGAMLGLDLPVHGAPLQMIVTETAPQLAPCLLAHADRHLTMKQASVGNIIIGGAWSASTDNNTGRSRILRQSIEGNLWVAERVLPELAGLHMLRSWAAMNVDIDGAPMVGPLPGFPGAVVVAGANGYTLGPLLGQVAAQSIINGSLPPAYQRFSPERFA
jgi:glycine/D-amino acid oxidase-like deaminating enzyme